MGIYARVLYALNLEKDITLLAADDALGRHILSGDLMNIPSLQHPRGNGNVFGFVKDSFPDRWVEPAQKPTW